MNLFVIDFPVALKMVQAWWENALEPELRTEVAPVSTKKFSEISSCTLGSGPVMLTCDRWAGWSSTLQSCSTIMREGLALDLEALGFREQNASQCPN